MRSALRPASHLTVLVAAMLILLPGAPSASAQEWRTLSTSYTVSIAGLRIGQLNLDGTLNDQAYRLAGSGRLSGIARLFASGEGESRSNGMFAGQRTFPVRFAHSEMAGGEALKINMEMREGSVRRVAVEPPVEEKPDRVPITAEHHRGVLDPMSALLLRVPEGAPLLSPAACERTVPVFDGRMRFDVTLSYAGTRPVESSGYRGDVVVCKARYVPRAGHRERSSGQRTVRSQEIDVWFAPVSGTRTLAPYRLTLQTSVGQLVVAANRFEVAPMARRAASD